MELARRCQSSRPSGSSGAGPRALTAHGRAFCAACSPIRSLRVHHPGDLRGERAALGVSDGGDLGRPRARRNGDNGADPGPEPGVYDRGQVAGPGQFALTDCGRQDLRGVQAGQLRGAHGPPQPPDLVAGLSPVFQPQAGHQKVLVVLLAGRGGLGGPDRVQDGQVVGVGQGLLPSLGRGGLLAISVQHVA
jgi:hypothetical protein